MNYRKTMRMLGAAVGAVAMLASFAVDGKAHTQINIALPAQSLRFAPVYIAQERGLFKAHGHNRKIIYVSRPGVMPAVLGRSAHFNFITGATHIAAAARDQKLLAISNTQDRVMTDSVVRSDFARTVKVAADADAKTKILALKALAPAFDEMDAEIFQASFKVFASL
ncbi:hypothetical protein [Tardiphaga sp. P5_C10]